MADSESPASENIPVSASPSASLVLPSISQVLRSEFEPGHQSQPPLKTGGLPPKALKRKAAQTPSIEDGPAKKQSKWAPEENNLTIELRGQGMK